MPTTDPAARLREAATTIRDKATRAIHEDRATWTTGNTLGSKSPVVVDHPEQPSVLIETYAARLEAVNSYLALIGPATGIALADWLERAAHSHEATLIAAGKTWASVTDPRAVAWVEHMTNTHALAVADAILGEVAR